MQVDHLDQKFLHCQLGWHLPNQNWNLNLVERGQWWKRLQRFPAGQGRWILQESDVRNVVIVANVKVVTETVFAGETSNGAGVRNLNWMWGVFEINGNEKKCYSKMFHEALALSFCLKDPHVHGSWQLPWCHVARHGMARQE